VPALQTCPFAQTVEQSPQCAASDATQAPPQSIPEGHWHAPPWQTCPVAQAMPQPPQFAGSVSGSTHCWPQAVCPVKQVVPVVPAPPVPVELPLAQAIATNARPSPSPMIAALFISARRMGLMCLVNSRPPR
jgi:hypothetical protein